ncbi:MAG TPA: methyltransferase domain-containing protein [Bryobacterales bacterium]|nr:methyltransferase domain-containing protein [Bryobacterales bacterium]
MIGKPWAGRNGILGCPRCRHSGFTVLFSATDRLYASTAREFQVVECGNCSLIRLEPQPSWEEIGAFYPENYWWAPDRSVIGRLEGIYRRIVLSDHVRFVEHGLERGALVLDVGCGGGSFLSALRRRGMRGVGLDFSAGAAAVAWRSQGVPALCGLLESSPFAPESFGGITMFHVLEHVPDPSESLAAARRLLSPAGKLYVQVPNAACWQFLLLGDRWSGIDVPRHLIDFRKTDVEQLLEETGFVVRREKFFSLRDNPAGLATSLAPGLEPMSRRARRVRESGARRLLKNLVYLALSAAAVPFTALEAAAGAGSTVLIEAVKK